MPAGSDAPSVYEDVDVVPVCEVVGNRAKGGLVGDAEVLESLIGEHDAPAECIVRPIPLEHNDIMPRVSLLEQQRCVESRGSAADDDDFQLMTFSVAGDASSDIICLKQRCRYYGGKADTVGEESRRFTQGGALNRSLGAVTQHQTLLLLGTTERIKVSHLSVFRPKTIRTVVWDVSARYRMARSP